MIAESSLRPKKRTFGVVTIVTVLCLLIMPLTLGSCAPEQVIGRLLICSDIDSHTFEPLNIGSEYEISSKQIFAAVKVAGVRGSDEWRFIWKNADTGEVIADSKNIYSPDRSSFMKGYLSNKLIPGEDESIIAEPGSYIVSYYHNEDLMGSAGFIIKKPEVSILEVKFYRDIDRNGEPVDESDVFSQKDIIYMGVKVDYKVEGDSYKIKWFAGDEFLGEEDLIIDKNYYMPGYIVVQLTNKDRKPFPVDRYRVQISHDDRMVEEYYFEIAAEEFTEEIFAGETFYQNDDFGFTIIYPDGWSSIEENMEEGPRARFAPEDGVRQVTIEMWIIKKNYSPDAGGYSAFADKLLDKQIGQENESSIEKTESEKTIGDTEVFEIKYDNWEEADKKQSMTFSFFKKNSILFLFMRLTDIVYIDYGEKVADIMIDSISFTE